MNYISLTNAFDLFISCYIYGCLSYVLILFLLHLYYSLLIDCPTLDLSTESFEADFYTQVKDLLHPAPESIQEPVLVSFESMTIRELRTYIKENKLHQQVRGRINKTVSQACKHELIQALS